MQSAHVADIGQQRAGFVERIGLAGFAGPRRGQDVLEIAIDVAREAQGSHDVARRVADRRLDPGQRVLAEEWLRGHQPRIGGIGTDELRAAREYLRELRRHRPRLRAEAADLGKRRRDDAAFAIHRVHRRDVLVAQQRREQRAPCGHFVASAMFADVAAVGTARELGGQRGDLGVTRPALTVCPPLGDEHLERLGLGIEQRGQPLRAQFAQRALDSDVHPRRGGRDRSAERKHDEAQPAPARKKRRAQATGGMFRSQRR